MLGFLCAFVVLYVLVSLIWPSSSKADSNRKHQELLAKIEDLQRQVANPPPTPSKPTFGSAERARILALGKIRDGAKRHPILDEPSVSVANRPEQRS